VVDDDDIVLATVDSRFCAAGFTVTAAPSYTAALDAFAANRDIDVLVTDYNLSATETGIHLALTLRAARPDLPIVIFTGNPFEVEADTPVPGVVIVNKAQGMSRVIKATQELLITLAPAA